MITLSWVGFIRHIQTDKENWHTPDYIPLKFQKLQLKSLKDIKKCSAISGVCFWWWSLYRAALQSTPHYNFYCIHSTSRYNIYCIKSTLHTTISIYRAEQHLLYTEHNKPHNLLYTELITQQHLLYTKHTMPQHELYTHNTTTQHLPYGRTCLDGYLTKKLGIFLLHYVHMGIIEPHLKSFSGFILTFR